MLSYFKLLLLLYQVEQKGVRRKLLKVGTALETKTRTVLGTRPRTTYLFDPRVGAVPVRVVELYRATAAVGNVPEGTAVPVLLGLSPSH